MSRTIVLLAFAVLAPLAGAQQYLATMPGYDRYTTQPAKLRAAAKIARLSVTFNADSKSLFYTRDGKNYKYDLATKKEAETTEQATPEPRENINRGGGFGRGQQPNQMPSPDGNWTILYRKRNLYLKPKSGEEFSLTTDANDQNRLDYGSVTWTYNEELNQHLPFWWSTDSKKVAYYRFDESKIPDFNLTTNAAGYTNGLLIEPYPKAGFENAVTDIYVYDLDSKKTVHIDTRDGGPYTNDSIGHYVYGCEFISPSSPGRKGPGDGGSAVKEEFRFFRCNRRQNKVEWCAADPSTGKVRVIASDQNPGGWCDNAPQRRFLSDNNRFFWTTERNGFRNLDLMDMSGKRLQTTTSNNFELVSIVKVDEAKQTLWYMARGGETAHMVQLYRCQFDGAKNVRLTNADTTHSVQISPDGNWFVDTRQSMAEPPVVELKNKDGMLVATLAKSDLSEYLKLGARPEERITYKSADGKWDLYGRISYPSNFDPSKKYPVLIQTYNGPDSSPFNEGFSLSDDLSELGFLVCSFESRGGGNRGREFNNAAYMKLGTVEIDDIAAGMKSIANRPYVRADRVGIFGTSYGGYSSAMCLLRYPDVFAAASSSSPVTDWRHYDSIYTERYMWIPQENKEGYDAGSAMTYAKNLKGALMLYFGTLDDNVHPANTMALIRALQRERKSFEVQVTPDAGHSGVNFQRMLEFFIQNLVLKP